MTYAWDWEVALRGKQLKESIAKAKSFIKIAEKTLSKINAQEFDIYRSYELAATKRISLELTKSLVALRKPAKDDWRFNKKKERRGDYE